MTRLTTSSHPDTRRVIRALSLPGLIRLVSELDDHGPISRRCGSLQAAFDDLTADQLRHAIDRARDFGLIYGDEDERVRYRLTPRGEDLADVYDRAARWARSHQFPTAASDFVTRVQHTLTLLGQVPAAVGDASRIDDSSELLVPAGTILSRHAITDLDGPRTSLGKWLQNCPPALTHTAALSFHAVDERESAA